MFQLVKDVDEFAAREAAKQQPIVITIRDRQRGESITATLAVVRTGAANQPAIAVAAPLEGNSNLICAHRDTAKGEVCDGAGNRMEIARTPDAKDALDVRMSVLILTGLF